MTSRAVADGQTARNEVVLGNNVSYKKMKITFVTEFILIVIVLVIVIVTPVRRQQSKHFLA